MLENNIRAVFQINETVPLNIMQVISTGCFVLLAFAQTVMADSSNKIASAPENNSGYLVIITIIILSVVAFLFFKRYKKGKFSKDLTHAQRDPFDSNKVNFDKLSPSKEKVVWGDTSQTIDLSGSGIFSVSIVGESYYQENLKQICGGYSESETDMILTAVLVYDDENQYDNKAIKVEISGKTVGHLSQADAINYRTHMLSKGWSGLSVICKEGTAISVVLALFWICRQILLNAPNRLTAAFLLIRIKTIPMKQTVSCFMLTGRTFKTLPKSVCM